MSVQEEVMLEVSLLHREALERVRAKIASQQLGELFADLKQKEESNG